MHAMSPTPRPQAATYVIRGSAKLALLLAFAMAPWAALAWLLNLLVR